MRNIPLTLSAALLCAFVAVAQDAGYREPPQAVANALSAAPTPSVSVSPRNDYAVFMQPLRYPPIADVAQPMLRLAGIRIDANTNGMHLAPTFTRFWLMRLSDGAETKLSLPASPKLGEPIWSPDGKQFAFTNTADHEIELWLASTETGQARRLEGVAINGVEPTRSGPQSAAQTVQWLGDSRTLLVHLVPAARGPVPSQSAIPKGPDVQETLGHAGPAPTFEDLLKTTHDEDLFDYYATSQLAYIDSSSGK